MNFNKPSLKSILKLYAEQMGVDEVLEVCKDFEDDQEVLSEPYQIRPPKLRYEDVDVDFQSIISGE